MNDDLNTKLTKIAKEVRLEIIKMAYNTKTGHLGSSLSIVDLLVVLYFDILNINHEIPNHPDRDYFILSKGHAAPALYCVLAHRGFFSKQTLETYHLDGGKLHGHICRDAIPGIEVSTGSLGHGLSIATGLAHAAKKTISSQKIYTLIGDGECNEGSIWEAAMYASRHKLDNLIAILDYNKYQGFGHSHEVSAIQPLADKWRSFGWGVIEIDGHNIKEIKNAYDQTSNTNNKPTIIVAHTISGKGVPHIENSLDAHYYRLEEDVYRQTIKDLYA